MKTHLPTGLRKALIAAIFAVSAVAYNAQADTYDLNNKREGEAPTYYSVGGFDHNVDGTGYTDLTISGTECTAGTVRIYAHDYDYYPIAPDEYHDRNGDVIDINVDSGSNGVYEFSSIRVYEGGDGTCPSHSYDGDFGYGSHSDGNLTITGSAKVSVSHGVDADGVLTVKNNGLLTGDTSVEAASVSVSNGEICVKSLSTDGSDAGIALSDHGVLKTTNGDITSAKGISATGHSQMAAENGNITAGSGDITVSEYSQVSAANGTVSASGTVKADGINSSVTAVNMKGTNLTADNGGHLEATNMEGTVTAQHAGSVNATTITGNVLAEGASSEVTATNITGNVTAKDAGTVNATTITGSATADNSTLNATTITNGAIAKNNGILTATNISGGAYTETNGTIQTDKQITGSVSGSNGVIAATAGQGLTITDNLAATNDTLITGAGETVTIGTTGDGNISGDGNFIGSSADHSTVVASNIQVKGDISGDSNKLSATGTNLADGISAIAVGGDISGDSNKLTVTDEGDIVVGGDVAGDANNLTIMGDGDISVLDDITGDSNSLTVEGDGSISVSDAVSGDGNTLSTEGEGDITVGVLGRQINTGVIGDKGAVGNKLTAADGDISIDTFSDNSSLTVTATEGKVTVQEDSKATLADSAISAKGDITIGETAVSTKTLKLTESTTVTSDEGSVIVNQNSVTDASSIKATAGDVTLAGTTNTVQNGSTVDAAETVIITGTTNTIDASSVTATGTSVAEGEDALTITGTNTIGSGATVKADNGNITLSTATTVKDSGTKVTATTGDITATGTSATIKDSAAVEATAGDVTLSATTNTVANNATVEAAETITIEGTTNTIDNAKLTATGTTVAEGEDALTITGTNTIGSGATVTAENGNITMSTASTVKDSGTKVTATTGDIAITGTSATIKDSAAVEATAGDVTLSATTNTVANNATVEAAETITIEGTTNTIDNAKLTATGTGVAEGEDALTITGTNTIKGGATVKAENGNITLSTATTIQDSNTKLTATTGDITATGVAATITDNAAVEATAGNVTLSATTNKVQNGASVTAADTISLENTTNVSGNATLTADTIDVVEGAVVNMGAASANALAGKLSGTGTINAGADNLNLSYDDTAFTGTVNMGGKKLTISDKGVGADATINLTGGADMDVTADASLGHVTAGSGSEVRLNPGTPDGTATASTLAMGAGSTLHIDTTDGTVADAITITESFSIATPGTVYVNGGAQDALAAIAGDTSATIIKLEDGAVNNGVSEDVRYDMAGGQRVLQDKNMSLVATKDGVNLVISDNFRGISPESTKPNEAAVNATMKALSSAADHTYGTLSASDSKLDNILDALDNTQSTAATKSALQTLSGAGNLVVPNMMMDTTRNHLSTLRGHMGDPTCYRTDNKGIRKGGNVWGAYTGGHDRISGDSYTGSYKHSYQGAIVGADYSLNCMATAGIALGYENARSRMERTKADSDAIFADLYTTLQTGRLTHRFSAGVAVYDIDMTRHASIAAGGHSYSGTSKGNMDAMSWNLGYEVSSDFKVGQASTLTPFAAVDVAFHSLDTLREKGQGDASVITKYDDPVQVDIAAGATYTHAFRSFTAESSKLHLTAALHGELSENRPSARNQFVGGGADWKVRSAERTPIYGEIGAAVNVPVYKNWAVGAGAAYEFGGDRQSVSGNVGVNCKF